MTEKQIDIIKGIFYGQAIGDALGLGTEFLTKEQIAQYYPMGLSEYHQIIQDSHRSRWVIGDWTDDTDQFLCICDAITENKRVDELDFAKELYKWFKGRPLGIGTTVYKVLSLPQFTLYPHKAAEMIWNFSRQKNAANGAIMRTSLLGTFEFWNEEKVINNTIKIAKVTHWDNRCLGSCVIITTIISSILNNNTFLNIHDITEIGNHYDDRIAPFVNIANTKNIEDLELDEPSTIGYTLKALAAGLWAYFNANTFEEGLLKVINEGGDADTNAAVAGSLLGAKFGYNAIPKKYIDGLAYKDELQQKFSKYLNVLQEEFKKQ